MMSIDPTLVPELLRNTHRWVVYRLVPRGDKLDKPPFDHRTGQRGDITDPAVWMPLAKAIEVAKDYDGLGFAFASHDDIAGIDLDKCVSTEGVIEPWAERIVHAMQSYTEFSPSRRGLHILVRGTIPPFSGHKVGGFGEDGIGAIEVYDRDRYFTVTGDHLEGTPERVENRDEELFALCRELFPPKEDRGAVAVPNPNGIPDDDLLDIARRAWNGKRFKSLFDNGELTEHNGDSSRADMALCSHLAFWTGGDSGAIDRLFRRSALMRDKWDERRGKETYGERTIAKTLGSMRAYFCAGGMMREPGCDEPDTTGIVEALRRARSWEPPSLARPEPPLPFPVDVLPPDLAWLVEAGAECMSCPRDFLGVASLAIAGAAIGRSLVAAVKDSWLESASLYVSAVADPGSTKSPALSLMSKPLWAITEECLAQHHRDMEQHRNLQQQATANRKAGRAAAAPDAPPTLRRIAVSDATCEALGPILADNPRGIIMVKDELTALVAGLNQYKSGGKGADRQFFLSAWSGTGVTIDRKGRYEQGPLHIPHPFLSILGAMTPDMLSELAEGKGRDDGFIDRFLFTLPDPVRVRWVPETVPAEALTRWGESVRALWGRPMQYDGRGRLCPRFIHFSPDALYTWVPWHDQHCSETDQFDFPHQLKGAWSKFRAYSIRLALVLNYLHHAYDPTAEDDPTEIGPLAALGSIRLTEYFKAHCRRVKALINGSLSDNEDAQAVLRWLRSTGRETVSERDIHRNFPKRFGGPNAEAMPKALEWLVARHCLRVLEQEKREGPGRKRSQNYEVNPAILSGAMMHAG